MNAFAALGLAYFLFTLISSGLLYLAFRKRLDHSARYFLFSELCMVIACGILFLVNIDAIEINRTSIGIPNFAALAAEVAMLFSILSITQKMSTKRFFSAIIAIAILTIGLEFLRDEYSNRSIILINATILTLLFFANYLACKNKLLTQFPDNQFIQFLRWITLGLVGFGLIRVLANFSSAPIIPRGEPTTLAIMAYTLFIILGTFRYMTYIGFRITWVDRNNPQENILNQPLVKAIEEKNQFLKGLIASNRFIGISALASSLAHQLSQPLTTIAIRAETARRDLTSSPSNTQTISSLNEISNQSNQLAELVNNLRGLFRSKVGKFESINLQKICNEILEIIKPTLQTKQITLIKRYESNPTIYGDSVQLQQVLINLFNNAIDAITDNESPIREILITISNTESVAVLSLTDSGPGIDSTVLESLFELYKTTKSNGLGVGLWLSKTIIEMHQGTICGFNTTSGGACFEIQIPFSSKD